MNNQLTHTKLNVDNELHKLDNTLTASVQMLAIYGLDGPEVRTVLRELVSNNSLIINAATSNAQDILVAIEPTSYKGIEGMDISQQEQNLWMHQSMLPEMSNIIPLVESFPGVVMVAPIFDSIQHKFIGSLSIVFQPYESINKSVAPAQTV
ncbi:MAG: hypothetical protein GX799_04215 [Crenarchaeota archaeon]|jgi:hypothetical protein|nr:hypothetical protein [Thermoproteota archaeon]